jgi:CBS domain-containing protein
MRLAVRTQHILGPSERVVRLRVFCPARRESLDYEQCRACAQLASEPESPGAPGASIECEPSPPPAESAPVSLAGRSPTGPYEAIGAIVGPRILCVRAELPVSRLPHAFREWTGVELPDVDAEGRLLGTVLRDDFQRRSGYPAARFEGEPRVAQRLDTATALYEGASIEHAVEVLSIRRARNLVLVRADETVVGVLTDLELLRWLTLERKRRFTEAPP